MEPSTTVSSDKIIDEDLPRFVVGIDLGTTNSVVSYVDTADDDQRVRTFLVRQAVTANETEQLETLPSFHYQPVSNEISLERLGLPTDGSDPEYVVGRFARDHGMTVPGRVVSSAKSWLCHAGVDRSADILPWHGAEDVERISPVEASARYLKHMRLAWDAEFPDDPLCDQDLVITLPASFDEVARELTVAAARVAGLPRIVLIEEPQAAFYAWIQSHAGEWDSLVEPGQRILVCDVGGGTSDFTLIQAAQRNEGEVEFQRIAVGNHLILGGDNLDIALAHEIERRLDRPGGRLESHQWDVLVRVCRNVKESLLAIDAPESMTVVIPGSGSKLIGGSLQTEISREEVESLLVEGFLPQVDLDEKPTSRESGFQEFGLPYAADAAITRYLASFLTAHRRTSAACKKAPSEKDSARPDFVLFNGGLFNSPVLRTRVLEVLQSWFDRRGKRKLKVLENERLDLAVSQGAAYYGMVRRGHGVRIAANLARTYYIGLEAETASAVCLVPADAQPGEEIDLADRQFELLISEPIEFPLFVSSTRLNDRPGEIVEFDRDQMTPLPPIRTVLKSRNSTEGPARETVTLHAGLTEIGTLELWCAAVAGRRTWKLQFDVRSTTQTNLDAHQGTAEQAGFVEQTTWDKCQELINETFGARGKLPPERLAKQLSQAIGQSRKDWPPSLLRGLWEMLMEQINGRRKSANHEARWLNLVGFALRPGFGLAVDDWRVSETWKALPGKLQFATPTCRSEWWILWRRIAGGLQGGWQRQLAQPLLTSLRGLHKQMNTGKGRGGQLGSSSHETSEMLRFLGSLELLDLTTKVELGEILVDLLPRRKMEPVRSALVWAIGRIGSRVPFYGPINGIVSQSRAEQWLSAVMDLDFEEPVSHLAVMQLSRNTGDRYANVSEACRQSAADWLESHRASGHLGELVLRGGRLASEEAGQIFGESLPKGLRLQPF